MKVIDLDTAKTLLGITDTTYDTQLSANIPIIDAKVKQICGNNFNLQVYGKFTEGSTQVEVYGVGRSKCLSNIILSQMVEDIPVGTLIEGDPITSVGRIDETYYTGYAETGKSVPYFELNEEATESGNFYFYAGINYAYQSVIAKGLVWLINNTSMSINDNGWKSKSGAGLSVTKGAVDEKLDGASGMPAWFVKALPRYHS